MSDNLIPNVDFTEEETHAQGERQERKLKGEQFVEMQIGELNAVIFGSGDMAINLNAKLLDDKGEVVTGFFPKTTLSLPKQNPNATTEMDGDAIQRNRNTFYSWFRTLDSNFPAKARWIDKTWQHPVTGESLSKEDALAMNREVDHAVTATVKKLWNNLPKTGEQVTTANGTMVIGDRASIDGFTGQTVLAYVAYSKAGKGPYFNPTTAARLPDGACVTYGTEVFE